MANTIQGKVISNKSDKTIVILTHFRKSHPLYKKQYTVSKKYMAHDPNNEANIGDLALISPTRPISRRKHFILTKIIEKSEINQDKLEILKVNPSEDQKSPKTKDSKEKES